MATETEGVNLVTKGILRGCLLIFLCEFKWTVEKFNLVCKLTYKFKRVTLLRRLTWCFSLRMLKVSTRELVHKYLFISPMATPLLTPGGWNELACIQV